MTNVPRVPGVPGLASYAANAIVLLFQDVIGFVFGGQQVVWGIFLDGEPVIEFDSMISFDLRQDLPVSDYQVEEGGFQSYNKVQLPTDIRVRLSTGGSISRRQRFLQDIDAVMNTTDLYDIVTPEAVYLNYNFSHRDFRRNGSDGAGLITVDLWMTEIRETATATFTNTQQPQGAGQQSSGNVQPQTPTGVVEQGFASGNWTVQ